SGEARVGLGPADLEPTGRVHQDPDVFRVEVAELAKDRIDDLRRDVGREQRLDVDLLAMLDGDEDRLDSDGGPALVPDRDLALAVGPQIRNDARLADVGQ